MSKMSFMSKIPTIALVFSLGLSLTIATTAPAKAKTTKPSAPTITAISSSSVKKGKVDVKVTIILPASKGGSKITGSTVIAGGKSCTIAKTKTSCTIKSIKEGKAISVFANSKNIKGFGPNSARVTYVAGGSPWLVAPVALGKPNSTNLGKLNSTNLGTQDQTNCDEYYDSGEGEFDDSDDVKFDNSDEGEAEVEDECVN